MSLKSWFAGKPIKSKKRKEGPKSEAVKENPFTKATKKRRRIADDDDELPSVSKLQVKQETGELAKVKKGESSTAGLPKRSNDDDYDPIEDEAAERGNMIKREKGDHDDEMDNEEDLPTARFKGSGYDPIKDAGWKKGQKGGMPYKVIANAFSKLEATTKRLIKIEVISNLLRSVIALAPDLLLTVVYLCVNKIAPPYMGLELGIGDQVIMKAISESTGRNMKDLKSAVHEIGDLGQVAENSRKRQRCMFPPPPLTAKAVFETFLKVAKTTGNKSMFRKSGYCKKLFVSAKENEARYIVRHLQGKMRLGLAEQTVFAALGLACALTPPGTKKQILDKSKHLNEQKMQNEIERCTDIIKMVCAEMPNFDRVIPALVRDGINKLHANCHLTPGIPIKVMLAKPTTGIAEILERFKNIRFTLEFKYDGERAQIHMLNDGTFRFYSRSAEDNTSKFPDLAANIPNYIGDKVTSFMLDSEVVAYDRIEKKILPFQTLTHRKRKDVKEDEITIQVCIYAFDLLYLNGQSLIRKPFSERRALLHKSFKPTPGCFMFADHMDSADPEQITEYLDVSIKASCEGLMVKTLDVDATYEPSKPSHNWLKCKKDYLDGCGDTLDLVPLGGFFGVGKRKGTYGSILVGCYDDESEMFQSICKIGTGFSDENLATHTAFYKKNLLPKCPSYYQVSPEFKCDVWFKPMQVWEVKCADLTVSPKHLAGVGLVHDSKGIALRFPRFMRLRDDKEPENATNSEQVAEMYRNQAVISNGAPGPRR